MTAQQRRQAIWKELEKGNGPVSATALAHQLGVSRQIIVGDVALLRAGGRNIASTSRGYVIPAERGLTPSVVCRHTAEQTAEEMYAIVDCGCTILDVIVEHPVYGELTASLLVKCRYDVDQFLHKMQTAGAQPLSLLTEGIHLHTLSAPDAEAFVRAEEALRQLGVLIEG